LKTTNDERVEPALDAVAQAPGRGRNQVLLSPAQQAELVIAVGEVVVALAAGDEIVGEALDQLTHG
jgi:hypothetical protein